VAQIIHVSRRQFIQSTGLGAVLVLGAQIGQNSIFTVARAQSVTSVQPNLFVSIDLDGTVTITCNRSEMGQGVRTGIPMILADELEADWSRVKIWQAPGDETKYDPAGKDGQNTDGSRSTRHHFEIMRELGASARNLLERAAAVEWDVDPSEVYAKHHRLYHTSSGRSFDFGELVDAAANLTLLTEGDTSAPRLKHPSEWKYIGKDLPMVDNFDMSTGGAVYGADVPLPGMKIAVIARSPVYRGRVRSFNATEALQVSGVEQVIEIPAMADDTPTEFRALGGVAVIGTNTWSVMEGRSKLEIEWDDGPFTVHDSSTFDNALRESARRGGSVIRRRGDVDEALSTSDSIVESEYFVPYLVHTPMEPPVALVDATVRPVQVWAATQSPNETRQYVAEALGLEKTDVECHITLLGGSFGRKSKPDFACEAAILSDAVGAPVRVQWTREDEVRNGYYHAASAQYIKAGLDASGNVTAWHHSAAWPSMMALWAPDVKAASTLEAGLGLIDLPYNNIPNLQIETGEADAMIRVGWYRSVNNIQHAFATNCFVNELAVAAGKDPLEFMLGLIGDADEMDLTEDGVEEVWNYGDSIDDWPIMPKRLSNVLRTVAQKSGYGKQMADGHGLGLACHRSFHSYVAIAVHVVVRGNGSLHIPQVDVAIDCGRCVNPEGVRKQIEGAVVFGHTIARHGKITTSRGAVEQSNFHDYPLTRIGDTPLDVRVEIVDDYVHLRPCGVGEPGVPPYAPALANAIFSATGKRHRALPLTDDAISI
jgi:isoquinoline 1-oxidoreductase beta subunit